MKLIDNLIITQSNLRNPSEIGPMLKFAQEGGFFSIDNLNQFDNRKPQQLIQISKFEDNFEYIHDGHHRILAIYLANRDYLRTDEYEVKEWKYNDYMTININRKFVTPFDPRKEWRFADFEIFKKEALLIHENSPKELKTFIGMNAYRYKETRIESSFHIDHLANRLLACLLAYKAS